MADDHRTAPYVGPDQCPDCGGWGWFYVGPRGDLPPEVELPRKTCEACGGSGQVPAEEETD